MWLTSAEGIPQRVPAERNLASKCICPVPRLDVILEISKDILIELEKRDGAEIVKPALLPAGALSNFKLGSPLLCLSDECKDIGRTLNRLPAPPVLHLDVGILKKYALCRLWLYCPHYPVNLGQKPPNPALFNGCF